MNRISSLAKTSLKIGLFTSGIALTILYLQDSRAQVHKYISIPLIHHFLTPEDSHNFAIWCLKHGIVPRDTTTDDSCLNTKIWNKYLTNPIGLAAGFDKNAEGIDGLLGFGFGLVEVGSITPEPQPGNPKPRMFRLDKEKAVINRYGFNSLGHDVAYMHLLSRLNGFIYKHSLNIYPTRDGNQVLNVNLPDDISRSLKKNTLLGINLGKNKTSEPDSTDDYVKGIQVLGGFADYIVINISSPNTPGLRSLQRKEPMLKLLNDVKMARDKYLFHSPPLVVKIAPDLNDEELEDISRVIEDVGIDGVIISNTTISRPEYLTSENKQEIGGLSGPPVMPLSLDMVGKFYKLTNGRIPIIGCGGIRTGKDAIEYAKAGATVVQLYTALGYEGAGLIAEIKQDITDILKKNGQTWNDIIGENHKG